MKERKKEKVPWNATWLWVPYLVTTRSWFLVLSSPESKLVLFELSYPIVCKALDSFKAHLQLLAQVVPKTPPTTGKPHPP